MKVELTLEESADKDEQEFVDAANTVHEAVSRLDSDLAFMACGTVMLDMLEDMFNANQDPAYPLMLANQIHAEFITLMTEHGFDLSVNSVQ